MPLQARAKVKRVGQAILADLPSLGHLGLGLELVVDSEERVENEIAKVARKKARCKMRIKDAHKRLLYHAKRLGLLRMRRFVQNRRGRKRKCHEAANAGSTNCLNAPFHIDRLAQLVPGKPGPLLKALGVVKFCRERAIQACRNHDIHQQRPAPPSVYGTLSGFQNLIE